MPEETLRLDNIGFGQLLAKANEAITRICEDVITRKLLKEGQKVKVEIVICPDASEDGEVNTPIINRLVCWLERPRSQGPTDTGVCRGRSSENRCE